MKAYKTTRTLRVTTESVVDHLLKEEQLDPALSVTLHECESSPKES